MQVFRDDFYKEIFMKTLKLVAFDIDGVLLKDTFSPVIKLLVEKFGGTYNRDIERNIFSQKREEAAEYLINLFKLDLSTDELIKIYFKEREEFINRNGSGFNQGLDYLLKLIESLNLLIICYGGLPETYYRKEMKQYTEYFTMYVCTNDFRPGIKEITTEIYNLKYNEALFIDDVNMVAEAAKSLNVPFIGMPSSNTWGYQKKDMVKTGVKYLINSLNEINLNMIKRIDYDASTGNQWNKNI